MPPQNPPISPELRQRCKTYLTETHYSKWVFTDFWDGDKDQLSGCGDVWLKALLDIVNKTDNHHRCLAAVTARNRYREREHLPESERGRKGKAKEGSKKRKKKGLKVPPTKPPAKPPAKPLAESPAESAEPPPSYDQASQPSSSPSYEPKPQNLHEYHHHTLTPSRKWRLSSGRYVEDVLFSWAVSQTTDARRMKREPRETYAHSYILDVDDERIQKLFNDDDEWPDIVALLMPAPEVEKGMEEYMHKFAHVTTPSELRSRLVSTPYLLPGEVYIPAQHADLCWVYSALTSLLVLYDHSHLSSPLHLEASYQINVWGPIFDRCFQYIPSMTVVRSESQSAGNADRKHDPAAARKPVGSKYDGIVVHAGTEFGAVEDGRVWEGVKGKKWREDELKVAKVLHDQLRALEGKVCGDREVLGRSRCAGFLTAGLHCQSIVLQYGNGHVCLLKRGDGCDVPESVKPLSSLIAAMVAVWKMREIVKGSMENLEAFMGNTEVMFRAAVEGAVRRPAILPICFDTDSEL